MKKIYLFIGALATLASFNVMAAAAKSYQVTGPVLEVTDTMIAVQKGQDRWELNRDASTKVNGDLKVGAKVTIQYTMTAQSVEVKPAAGAAAANKPAAASKPAAAKPAASKPAK
jgi:hypothetical protein